MSTTIGTDSYPFVPGQCMLTFVNGIPIVNDESNNDLLSDLSYQLVFKLHETTETNNLEQFKQLYTEEYISNPAICNFFKFENENVNKKMRFNRYSLCTCSNKEDKPYRIHRDMYVRPCNCSSGKRYLAYLSAYNSNKEEDGYGYDTQTNILTFNKKHMITPIQQFLLDDGPIDLTYTHLFYKTDIIEYLVKYNT